MLFGYDSGAQAVLTCTLRAKSPTRASIVGTDARIEIDGDFYAPAKVTLIPRDGEATMVESVHEGRGLRHQADEVARRLAAGELESPLMPLDETISIMETIDAVQAQAQRIKLNDGLSWRTIPVRELRAPEEGQMSDRPSRQELPPGPRAPSWLQLLGTWMRPTASLERLRRYGKRITVRLPFQPPFVMLWDPAEIKELFTRRPMSSIPARARGSWSRSSGATR